MELEQFTLTETQTHLLICYSCLLTIDYRLIIEHWHNGLCVPQRPGRTGFKPKTQKMVLVTTLLNTQHYKVRIKGSGAIQGKE